jgi:hemerythrin-like domain-containing protein
MAMAKDALSALREDHRRLESLLEQLERAGGEPAEERAVLARQVRAQIERHVSVEDGIFYPAFRAKVQGPNLELADHAREQHHLIATVARELGGTAVEGGSFQAKVEVLVQQVRRHMDDEDSSVFTAAEDIMSDDELLDLGRRLDERRHVTAAQAELVQGLTPPTAARSGRVLAILAGGALLGAVVAGLLAGRRRGRDPRRQGGGTDR